MKRLLIIDDDDILRGLLQKFFTKIGYQVSVAKNGKEGISLFKSSYDFDAVITDIDMPGMDGFAVSHLIRNSKKPHIPIMAITGRGLFSFQNNKFDIVLSKPFSLDNLESKVKHYLS